MDDFKIIEIVNANTIRVSPNWAVENKQGDLVKISGLDVAEDDQTVKQLLNFFIDKYVDIGNPVLIEDSTEPEIECVVYIDNTDITYYFPPWRGSLTINAKTSKTKQTKR